MIPARPAAVFAAVLALAAAALLIAVVAVPPAAPPSPLVTGADATPIQVADLNGPAPQTHAGTWDGRPVVVLKLATPVAGPSIKVPGEPGTAIVIFEAKSTHLGCLVEPVDDAAQGVLLRDICHHGAWDPSAGAEAVRGPAPKPLPQLVPVLERLPTGGLAIGARPT